MQDLKDVTQDIHYENYRSARLANGGEVSPLPNEKYVSTIYINAYAQE